MVFNMSLKEKVRKNIVQIGGILEEGPKHPQWDFGFKFKFPNKRGKTITIAKPKGKNFIEIANGTKLDDIHRKMFSNFNKDQKSNFIKKLHLIILNNNFESSINVNPERFVYVIIERLFIENEAIPVNDFYRSVKSVTFCSLKCNYFIQNQFNKDYDPTKDGFDANDFMPFT